MLLRFVRDTTVAKFDIIVVSYLSIVIRIYSDVSVVVPYHNGAMVRLREERIHSYSFLFDHSCCPTPPHCAGAAAATTAMMLSALVRREDERDRWMR